MTKTSEPCTKEGALAAWEAERKAHPVYDWYRPMVLRHGGRGCDRWHFRGWGEEKYEKLAVSMRQGGVTLVKAGKIVRFESW
jgi:hypothetical protein